MSGSDDAGVGAAAHEDRTLIVPAAAPAQPASGGDNALRLGTRVGEFEIIGLVGEGGFGIVYLAYDHSLDRKVAVKEYMPAELVHRQQDSTVSVRSQHDAETFAMGMRSFINEARLLAQFDHPSLVKVYRFWEANGTAYMAMPFYEGYTLKEALRRLGGAPDETWLKALLVQLLDALDVIHSRQCYHRDIAPDNILMLAGNTPVLLDFGAARRVGRDASQALTVIVKPGYAPIEQYAQMPHMKQGPWTDLYALASVVYFAITGEAPIPAVARVLSDPLVALSQCAAGRYSETFLRGIDAALAMKPEERPQDVAALRALMGLTASNVKPDQQAPAPAGTPFDQRAPTSFAPTTGTQQDGRAAGATTAPGAGGAAVDWPQLERLLAQYIGPLARIFVTRAKKTAASGGDFMTVLAGAIDDEKNRAAFRAAALKVLPQ